MIIKENLFNKSSYEYEKFYASKRFFLIDFKNQKLPLIIKNYIDDSVAGRNNYGIMITTWVVVLISD